MKIKSLALTLTIFALASCTAAAKDPANSTDTVGDSAVLRSLTAADNGKTITLAAAAKTVQITLDGNPTTGYSWTAKADGKSLAPVGDVAYKRDAAPPGMAGSGGVFVATFNVAAPGTTTITMEYKRPWEATPAARTFVVTIDVGAKP